MAIEQTASPPTIESRVGADGVRYTWTEFMDYYDNADIAAELWETAQDVAPYEPAQTLASPRFEPGSIVRVVADRTPCVHPMDAEGILVAKVLDFADEGHCYVAPFGSKFHIASGALLTPTSIDGPTALFRVME